MTIEINVEVENEVTISVPRLDRQISIVGIGGPAGTGSGGGVSLGETSTTAYRGDRGLDAYTHAHTGGNPHETSAADVGADPTGTAATAVEEHVDAPDAHGDRGYADGLIAQEVIDRQLDTSSTLSSAQDYTDNAVSDEATLRQTDDAATLASANAYTDAAKSELLGGAPPSALDTLSELATQLGDDSDAIAALTSSIAGKLDNSSTKLAPAPDALPDDDFVVSESGLYVVKTPAQVRSVLALGTAAQANTVDILSSAASAAASASKSMDTMTEGTGTKILTSAERTKLSNTTGTNTGDQDLSSYVVTGDSRLSDTRTPTDGSVSAAKLDATETARQAAHDLGLWRPTDVDLLIPYTAFSGTWVKAQNSAALYGMFISNSSGTANGDYIQWSNIFIPAGTFTVLLAASKTNTSGIVDVLINGSSIGTVDLYNASTTADYYTVSTTYTLGTTALVTVRLLLNGKNASSSNYLARLSRLIFRRTL